MTNNYYPDNFPRDKERLLIDLYHYLAKKNSGNLEELNKNIRNYLKAKSEKGFFPAFWHLNLIYWRHFHKSPQPLFMKILHKNKIRSLSGIVPLSLFTRPQKSCSFNCVYCPTQKNSPKSYFNDEAAVMRAIRNKYHPYQQVKSRLIQFFLSGHPIDKVEIIIQGGTFSNYSKIYRKNFVKEIYRGCNLNIKQFIINKCSEPTDYIIKDFEGQKRKNEKTKSRIVGITIETRPDYIDEKEITFLRKLGVTRVELGVQSLDNEILKINNRGHDIESVIKATKLLKDSGFKITYHLMPGLLGSSIKKDVGMLKKVFSDERFRPDAIKLYPTQVVYHSKLYELFQKNKYRPLSETELLKIVAKLKKDIIPPWVRINRLVRDLTKNDVAVMTFPSNFRQEITSYLKEKKINCQCIRCREIRNQKVNGKVKTNIIKYPASDGIEYFIEMIDEENKLLGFLRLRVPEYFRKRKLFFIKELNRCLLIRELHIYGQQIPLGYRGLVQHAGLGKSLLNIANSVAQEYKAKKIAVISGIGVRKYYRKLGYRLDGEYMVKNISIKNIKLKIAQNQAGVDNFV